MGERQALSELAVILVVSQSAGGRGGDHAQLAAAFRAQRERQLVLLLRTAEDNLQLGRFIGAHKADPAEFRHGITVFALEFLGHAVADAHDHAALDLSLDGLDVDGRADVESGNGFFDLTLVVEDDQLDAVGVGDMTDGVLLDRAEGIGLGAVFAEELLPLKVGQGLTVCQSGFQLFADAPRRFTGHDRLARGGGGARVRGADGVGGLKQEERRIQPRDMADLGQHHLSDALTHACR